MKNSFMNGKLAGRLMMGYLFACVVPLILTSIIIYRVAAESMEETSMEFASAFSSQIVTLMDDLIDTYDRLTKSVLVDNDVITSLSEQESVGAIDRMNSQLGVRKIMMRLMTLKPEIKTACILTEDGQFYQFSSEGDNIDSAVLAEQPWVAEIRESSENISLTAVHTHAYSDRNPEGLVFTIGRKIRNRNGAVAGLILIDLDPTGLVSLSDAFLLARNQYNIKISITDANGGVLYDSDVASGRISWSEAVGEDIPLYQKNEKDYIVLCEQTRRAGLSVYAVIPRSSLLFKINKMEYVTIICVILCTLAVIGISIPLSGTVTKPVYRLQAAMRKMESGEYETIEDYQTGDEIGNLIASYNHMVLRMKELIETVYLSEIRHKNAKLLALQTQINPHMLYNTLEAIRMKALRSGAGEVAEMIKRLAKMFRVVLSGQRTEHRLKEEVEYVQNYLELQNLRSRTMFFLDIQLSEEMQECKMIPMILQPVIENSIEHGFRGHGYPLHIIVKGEVVNGRELFLRISDDGKGINAEQVEGINHSLEAVETVQPAVGLVLIQEEEVSIGLKNIAERIRLQYGSTGSLRVARCECGGACIEIRMPFQAALYDEK